MRTFSFHNTKEVEREKARERKKGFGELEGEESWSKSEA